MLRRSILVLFCTLVLGPAWSAGAFDAGPQPELVGWWTFDEGAGTTAFDASGNGNDGILNGDPEWVEGIYGGAIAFDGDGDFVDCGADDSLVIRDEITVACWIKVAAFTRTWEAIIAMGDDSYRMSRGPGTGDSIHFGCNGPSGGNLDATTVVTTDTWRHVVLVYDGVNKYVYIDGVEDARVASTGQINISSYNLHIGQNSQQGNRFLEGLVDEVRIYNRALTPDEVQIIMAGYAGNIATAPMPDDEAIDIPRDVALSWSASEFANTHDVYFGTVFDDVNDADRANPMGVLVSQGQSGTTYDPDGLLDFGQMYYWRVDEVNAPPDSTIFKGEVWSFTAEPFAYSIEGVIATSNATFDEGSGPERTVDGSGLNADDQHSTEAADMFLGVPGADPIYLQYEFDGVYKLHEMLAWNYNVQFELLLGFGIKDVTVEYSADGAEWTVLGDVVIAQATAKADYVANTAIAFGGVPARYVRLTVNSGWGMMGQYGLSEVRFMQIPAQAREPQPDDGDTGVMADATLSWRAGREAVSHEVNLGTDPNALVLVDTVDTTSYTPGDLEFGATYYWKINEVNEADEVSVWEGNIWNFSTQEYAVIDDMESYTDDEGNRIYETWIDGYGVDENGSQVGYLEAPFAEQTIVNSGSQSMPLFYDNTGGVTVSEAERDIGGANWTVNGADTLVVHFRGNPVAFLERADGSIVMGAEGADIWGTSDELRYAYKPLNGNGSIVARVDSVVNTDPWAKAGVMIRFSTAADAKNAMAFVTPDGRVGWQYRELQTGASSSTRSDPGAITLPHWVRLSREGDMITAAHSSDGVTWEPMVEAANPDEPSSLQIPMDSTVLIGLALTSHSSGNPTSAEFSGVATEGNATGAWQVEAIGVEQPSNDPGQLYVALEDTAGRVAVVNHPDENAVGAATWQPWPIPLSAFTGVNTAGVRTMFIGVGDRSGAASAGSGLIFIDDVGFGHPAAAQ